MENVANKVYSREVRRIARKWLQKGWISPDVLNAIHDLGVPGIEKEFMSVLQYRALDGAQRWVDSGRQRGYWMTAALMVFSNLNPGAGPIQTTIYISPQTGLFWVTDAEHQMIEASSRATDSAAALTDALAHTPATKCPPMRSRL